MRLRVGLVAIVVARAAMLCGVCACTAERATERRPASAPPAPTDAAPDPLVEAIGSTSLMTPPLARALDPRDFTPTPPPEPGDWLAEHPEQPQTFDAYVASKFHPPTEQRKVLYLMPLGSFPRGAPELAKLATIVRAYFTLEVRVMPAVPLATVKATARVNEHTGKRQLLAPDILTWMKPRVPDDAYAVMALTMVDLYPEASWNFVFGMASLRDRVGVQSFARHDPAFFGEAHAPGWEQLALKRATWTVVHEISHMFGLSHCVHFVCVVAGSNSQAESDRAPLHACPVCYHKLWWAIRFDPVAREAALAAALRELGIDDEAAWSERRLRWIRDGAR